MEYLVNTKQMLSDGILNEGQVAEIEQRSQATMIALAINTILVAGIVAATLGLIFWLAEPIPVAIVGFLSLCGGVVVLRRGNLNYRIFGNAASIIGAGLWLGGASFELARILDTAAASYLLALGAVTLVGSIWVYRRNTLNAPFVTGSIAVMGMAAHLAGVLMFEIDGIGAPLVYGYCAAAVFILGLMLDVRFITALAIIPAAQMLDTSTGYFHAAYVFYSPESTLSILQMSTLIAACLWIMTRVRDRVSRHLAIIVMMAFIVMNLCFLVGSLWGDIPGSTLWGVSWIDRNEFESYAAYDAARSLYHARAFKISDGVYSIIWAIALAGIVIWAALNTRRGLLNAGLTFAGIHAYTQAFETFGADPMVFALGGLAMIPLAWGLMRVDATMKARLAQGA